MTNNRNGLPESMFGGSEIKRIVEIWKKGEFAEDYGIPGYHEHLGPLNDFERAIFTYMIEVWKEMRSYQKNGAELKGRDAALEKYKRKISTAKQFLLFIVTDRMNLWEKDIKMIGINKGKNVVAVDSDSLAEAIGISATRTEKVVESIDDLPDDIRNSLFDLVLSSKGFRPSLKFADN